MSFSDYLENSLLNHTVGKAAYIMPTAYVGLSTTNPLEDATGLAEPVGSAYARIATGALDWNSAAAGSIDNANTITFPTATGAWGTVTYFAIFDALTAGNMLTSGVLTISKTIGNGDTASFAPGQITITLD